ncbi:hypothetical protein BJV78DRAFT_648954 [Lactifluus subvellereus]|nr:hypothetical protein BJV78DRAFT_648954 [Lactifluus subvellereus]
MHLYALATLSFNDVRHFGSTTHQHSLHDKIQLFPVLGWTQLFFGTIVFRGYRRDGALPQCLAHNAAHYIMVRGFSTRYSLKGKEQKTLAILLLVGEVWIRRSGRSLDWWDLCVTLVWTGNRQHIYRASWQCVVCQGHAAYVRL